jgi:hypothetical protein
MSEELEEKYYIKINKETLRQIMIKAGIRTPNPHKKVIKRMLRERRASYGVMSQFDGSYEYWLENGEE